MSAKPKIAPPRQRSFRVRHGATVGPVNGLTAVRRPVTARQWTKNDDNMFEFITENPDWLVGAN